MPEIPEGLKRYYIVKEPPVRILSKCRAHSKGTLARFLIGICMLYAVSDWVPQIMSVFIPATNVDLMSAYYDLDPRTASMLPATPMVSFVYTMLLTGVFNMGECLYVLTYVRSRRVEYKALTEGMGFYFKALGVYLLIVAVTAFWTMFFIIPGVMAALNFSQAFYILADDPDKSVTQVLAESKIMMYGNRMNYVRLMLTYVPYLLLAYLPALAASALSAGITLPQHAVLVINLIINIPLFAVMGYISLGQCVFYELMNNKGFAYFRYAGQDAFRELES